MNVSDFEQLISQQGKSIYGFSFKLTNNTMDAEDLYQQTFLKAFEMLDKIDSEQYPKAFLLSICVGLYKNMKHKESRRDRIAPTFAITQDNEELLPSDDNLEKSLVAQEEKELVNKCINKLDEKFRIPILLYYNANLGINEISKVIKKPPGTVKTRLKRGRELIKTELEENGYERT